MDIQKMLPALPQFLILLPTVISCYLTVRNQLKYTVFMTAVLCTAVLVPYSILCAWLHAALQIDVNIILLPSLILFFFLYRCTVTIDLSRCLAVYVGVCAIETFPAQFAYAFDAHLHPTSGAANFSMEAAFFQLGLSCLMLIAFAFPASRYFTWAVDNLDSPKIYYSTVALSSVFLFLNILAVPHSYSTLQAGRLSYLFPLLEGGALTLLVTIYLLFYRGMSIILEYTKLQEHSQLLMMQANQYQILQEHLNQTARLRHDFRHSVRLLTALAEKGNIDSIRRHLEEYNIQLAESASVNYCSNAALNALLGYYHEMAVSAGIDTDWKIALPEPLTISELDLASLLGNLMDNAIAGCQTIPENSRYFCLTSELQQGNRLYIVSTNSFDGKVRKDKDGYRSTKHSGKGTGLASISAIAEKHHGSVQISHNNKEFFVDVVLKI